jgi:hypothetical protein
VDVDGPKIQRELTALGGVNRVDPSEHVGPLAQKPPSVRAVWLNDLKSPPEITERWGSATEARTSPQADIADFIMPKLAEPGILQGGRALGILEHLIADIIPTFQDSHELHALAEAVIATEIDRRRALLERLHRGIAA